MSLKVQLAELRKDQPNIRLKRAAQQLGVGEAQLLATFCGENVTRLRPEFEAILKEVHRLGKVLGITSNNEVTLERQGVYKNGYFGPQGELFVGPDIDLRIFLSAWASAFAVIEASNDKPRYSLQFFGKDGASVHKVYLLPESNFEVWEELRKRFRSDNQEQEQPVQQLPPMEQGLPRHEIDVEGFRQAWRELKDTHDFFGMLSKYSVTRTDALQLAPDNFAIRLQNSTLRQVLHQVAGTELPIMAFAGNRGMIQIHTGPIRKVMDYQKWLNVMDPEFNLHVMEPAISESWIVRKPTEDGIVTSLEFFNDKNELVLSLFGKRKPRQEELPEWRKVVQDVEQELTINKE